MVVTGSHFEHKNIHKGSWKSPDNNTVNTIDHMLIDGRHFSNIMDVRNRRGANIDSDHYLMETRIRSRISNIKKSSGTKKERYDVCKLKNEDVKTQYQEKLEGKLKAYNENVDSNTNINVNQFWVNCKQAIGEVAEETLGKIKGQNRVKEWFDEECKEVTNRKNVAYRKLQHRRKTRQAEEEYKRLRREEKRIHRAKKRNFMEKLFKEIDESDNQENSRIFYQKLNNSRKEFKPRLNICRDQSGNILHEKEEILERWAQNFEEKLNIRSNDEEYSILIDDDQREQEIPTIEEVQKAINKLKNNKAPGSDDIPAEIIKEGGESLLQSMHKLIGEIWTKREMPEEWKTGILIPLLKKGDPLICDNYRGITLLNISYKVFASILYERLKAYANKIVGDYQCGFCSGKSTTDQIFILRQVLEKTCEFNMETHHIFIDFRSAYDTIQRRALYTTLQEFEIPQHLIALVMLTLENSTCKIRIQNALSRKIETKAGLRQGDPLSTVLFNIMLEKAVRKANICQKGTILNKREQILAFADDVDIIARTKREATKAFLALQEAAKELGLEINVGKTKYMRAGIKSDNPQENLVCNNISIEGIPSFVYLGSTVTADNDTSAEIKRRLHAANKTYFGLQKHLKSDLLTRNAKCRIYKTLIRPVLMYGSETWVLSQNDENILGIFERKVLRHIYGGIQEQGLWRRRYNYELYELYQAQDIITAIKIGRLRWMGHVQRKADVDPVKMITRQIPSGKRTRGRPKSRYLDQIEADIKKLKIRRWKERAMNRTEWKNIIKHVKTL